MKMYDGMSIHTLLSSLFPGQVDLYSVSTLSKTFDVFFIFGSILHPLTDPLCTLTKVAGPPQSLLPEVYTAKHHGPSTSAEGKLTGGLIASLPVPKPVQV